MKKVPIGERRLDMYLMKKKSKIFLLANSYSWVNILLRCPPGASVSCGPKEGSTTLRLKVTLPWKKAEARGWGNSVVSLVTISISGGPF